MMYKNEKGFTLIEVLIATFVLLVAIFGSYLAFNQMTIETTSISYRFTAAYLAQEGIEIIRNIRDTNWINGASNWDYILDTCSGGCQVDYKTGTSYISFLPEYIIGDYLTIDGNGFYAYETVGTTPTKFKRKITITKYTGKLDILAEIMWEDKGKPYSFKASETLYNWK